jgi:hypothetical protein
MTKEEKNNSINDFFNSLKGKIIGAVTGLIVVFLVAKSELIISTFDKGKEIEAQIEFESKLKVALKKDSVVSSLMENEKFVKLLFESPTVKKHIEQIGEELHNKIVIDVTRSDSNKVSMRSFVGMGAGVRDEEVLPILTEIVKAWDEGGILTEKDIKEIVRKARTAKF